MRYQKRDKKRAPLPLTQLDEGVYYTKKYSNWMNQLNENKLSMGDIAQALEFERNLQINALDRQVQLTNNVTDFYVDKFLDVLKEKKNQPKKIANKKDKKLKKRRLGRPVAKPEKKELKEQSIICQRNPCSPIGKEKRRYKKKIKELRYKVNKKNMKKKIAPKKTIDAVQKNMMKKRKIPKKRNAAKKGKKTALKRKAIRRIQPMIHIPPLQSITDLLQHVSVLPKGKTLKPRVNKKKKRAVKKTKNALDNKQVEEKPTDDDKAQNLVYIPALTNVEGVKRKKKTENKKNNKLKKAAQKRKKVRKILTTQNKYSQAMKIPNLTVNQDFSNDTDDVFHIENLNFLPGSYHSLCDCEEQPPIKGKTRNKKTRYHPYFRPTEKRQGAKRFP